jgi:phosphohistidine phosphatase
MYIFIMRHGEAEQLLNQVDKQRNLTLHGETQAEAAGRWMKSFTKNDIELALVSPFLRTQQTYNALSRYVTVTDSMVCDDLVPSGNAQLVHDYIDVLIADKTVSQNLLLVSHMPIVSYLLDSLLNQQQSRLFATAAIAVVEYHVDSSTGQLLHFYHSD